MATNHRGEPIGAGKRDRDAYVQYLLDREPTIPPTVTWRGIRETAGNLAHRARYGAVGAAAGGTAGLLMGASAMMGGSVQEWADPNRLSHGLPAALGGAVLGAAANHMLMRDDKYDKEEQED